MNPVPRMLLLATMVGLSLVWGCSVIPHDPRSTGEMPAWKLPTADGDSLSSKDLQGRAGILIWIDPTCAEVQDAASSEGSFRLIESRWMEDHRVWIVYVTSRDAKDRSFLDAAMLKTWLKDQKLRGQVVLDSRGILADHWNLFRVPTASVVDSSGRIRWSGPAELASDVFAYPDVSQALDSVLQGKPVPPSQGAPSKGCTTADWLW